MKAGSGHKPEDVAEEIRQKNNIAPVKIIEMKRGIRNSRRILM